MAKKLSKAGQALLDDVLAIKSGLSSKSQYSRVNSLSLKNDSSHKIFNYEDYY